MKLFLLFAILPAISIARDTSEVCLNGLHPNVTFTTDADVKRTVRKLGAGGGPYETKIISFTHARYLKPIAGGCPSLKGFENQSSLIFDASAVNEGVGPGNGYAGNTYGSRDIQRAIQAYLKKKQFDDGVLDIFIQVRPGDSFPNADLSRAYEAVARFGSVRGAAARNGEASRGMKRNPANRRHVRIFVLGTPPNSETGEVPVEFFFRSRLDGKRV